MFQPPTRRILPPNVPPATSSLAALRDPATFAIKAGYVANLEPAYFHDDGADGVTWQPRLYPLVADLSRALGCGQIIDIGCGQAGKLLHLMPEFDVVGLDYGVNLAVCRTRYPQGRWIEIDLGQPTLGVDEAESWTTRRSGLVCGDVIEHLIDPRPLLELFKRLLTTSPFAAVSTPDRDLRRGASHAGPPTNPCHVREWTVGELAAFCRTAGLDVAWHGMTMAHTESTEATTALVILTAPDLPAASRATIGGLADHHL